MQLGDVHVTGQRLVLAKPAQVDDLEAKLWVQFPEGYREYVTKLGEGTLEFVRIYPPWRIEKELLDWRSRINRYWFWDNGRALLPKDRACECVILGDTIDGDELVFHPSRRGDLFVLPRHSETVFRAGADLWEAIGWICNSGKLIEPFAEREFEPFDSRKLLAESVPGAKVVDPEGESADDIAAMGNQWAKRRSARQMAEQELKKHLDKDTKATLLYEAFVMEAKYLGPGYLAVYRLEDKNLNLEVGTVRWHRGDDSYGIEIASNEANRAKVRKAK